jgi:serine/threonine protein kinase
VTAREGELLAGRFRLLAPLGAGGMGEVFAARDETSGEEVAVKVLPADAASDLTALGRFIHEAKASLRVRHPNVRAHELVTPDAGPPLLVLERLSGETLEARLARGPVSRSRSRASRAPCSPGSPPCTPRASFTAT